MKSEQVAEYQIGNEAFNLRLAKMSDILDVLELSNSNYVRKYSISQKEIKLDEHKKWFASAINNGNLIYLVVQNSADEFVGQVRFDLTKSGWTVSISIKQEFAGKGIGYFALVSGASYACKISSQPIFALVSPDNIPSQKLFSKAGFEFVENLKIDTKDFQKYKLI